MADLDRTVRVSGLPTDIEDDRLSDKLLILFLREKHGGGEVISLTIIKDPPGSALVTFEDSRVARRVIRHGQHVLKMDGMQYELTLTPHCERLNPDMVVLNMSVIIDCNQLPLRQTARKVLLENYPDIKFKDSTKKLCEITGPYSQVQAALAQLLGLPGCQKSEDTRSTVDQAFSGGLDMHAIKKYPLPESQLNRPYNSSVYTEQTYRDHTAGDYRSTRRGQQMWSTAGPVWEDIDKTETGAMQLSKDHQMLDEDLSLVMDADMFQYLQKHCGKEYRHILSQNGVEVLDVTSEGVTTLFLQCETKLGEVDSGLQRLRSARSQISQLYQDNETMICRVHLLKSTLPSGEVLHRIMDKIGVTHPKLLLNEDDQNIYLIGSYSDTSEAKKIIWGYNEPRGVSDQIGGLLRSTSLDLNSAYPLEGPSVVHQPILGSLRCKTDTLLGPNKDESRAEGATKYKLAAQFKYTEPGALGFRPADLTRAGLRLPSPAIRTALGPLLGSDDLSGTARLTDTSLSRQNTGEDVLFENGVRPSQSSTLGDNEQKFSESPPIQTPISPSGSVTRPALGTGLGFNYDSSSSEISVFKVQTDRQLDDEEPTGHAKYRVRDRANSLNYLKGMDRSKICSEQISVPYMMWKYIKEVYQPQFVEVTTAIKIKEQHTAARDTTTVFLTALDPSSVRACQIDLQNIVAKVTSDFSQCDLSLTELGISSPAEEILNVFCDEVRRRFKKVSIHTSKGLISILGPGHLCSQVASTLREVFSGRSPQIPGQQKCFSSEASTLASTSNEAISTNISKDQNLSLFDSNTTEHKQETNAIYISEHTDYIQNSDVLNVSLRPNPPLAQKETVIKEKVKSAGTMHSRRRSTVSQADTIIDSSAKPLDDSVPQAIYTSQNVGTLQKESNTQSTLLQNDISSYELTKSQQYTEVSFPCSNSGRSGQQGFKDTCLYCSSEESVKRVECGQTLCPGCMVKQHARCRVCPKRPQRKGIQGSIRFSDLSISLPGYTKQSTTKITYHIPDGIQGEGHPSPGLPFKGRIFMAYLPGTEGARRLLPRLQEAFKRGLIFTIQRREEVDCVNWDCIPHKTSIQGGKSQNGYPDANYLTRLSDMLTSHGV
ncbi:unnamed protein product [Lota lota]